MPSRAMPRGVPHTSPLCLQTLDANKELIQAISRLTGVLLIFFIT